MQKFQISLLFHILWDVPITHSLLLIFAKPLCLDYNILYTIPILHLNLLKIKHYKPNSLAEMEWKWLFKAIGSSLNQNLSNAEFRDRQALLFVNYLGTAESLQSASPYRVVAIIMLLSPNLTSYGFDIVWNMTYIR